MKTKLEKPISQQAILDLKAGMHVKTDIHAGDWTCRDCAGNVQGSSIFKPTCDYCQQT